MITFLTFAYNEGDYIEEAIQSVLCLNCNIEYILIDDNSTDNTWNIMQKYQNLDSRIKAFKNPKKGKNSAANYGMSKCSGNWVMILGGDDIFENRNFLFFSDVMEKYDPFTSQIFVGGLVKRFSDNPRYQSENGILNAFPKKGEHRACTNGFASRKILNLLYPIPEVYPNEDSWSSMYYYYFCDKIVNVPKVCLNYRIHANNSIDHNDLDFKKFSLSLHLRSNQQLDFISKYGNILKPHEIKYLENQYQAEKYRFKKKYIKLLFVNIALPEKIRIFLNSNRFLKNLKYKITKFAQQRQLDFDGLTQPHDRLKPGQ